MPCPVAQDGRLVAVGIVSSSRAWRGLRSDGLPVWGARAALRACLLELAAVYEIWDVGEGCFHPPALLGGLIWNARQ
jgi:hypothetical protein